MIHKPTLAQRTAAQAALPLMQAALDLHDATPPTEEARIVEQNLRPLLREHGPLMRELIAAESAAATEAAEAALTPLFSNPVRRQQILVQCDPVTRFAHLRNGLNVSNETAFGLVRLAVTIFGEAASGEAPAQS